MATAPIASGFIDLETLGKWDNSIILSLGITVLKDQVSLPANNLEAYSKLVKEHTAEFKFDIKEQYGLGRRHDKSTLEWWQGQGESAKRILVATNQDHSVRELFHLVEAFLLSHNLSWKQLRWFDRNSFDMTKLQHLHDVTLGQGSNPPWDYQQVWEIATFLKFCSMTESRYGTIDPYKFEHPEFIYHSAGCDAALDALRFYRVFHPVA